MFGLVAALGFLCAGLLFMVAWEHPVLAVLEKPSLVLWNENGEMVHAGRFWFIGPMLVAIGAFWIAEDWFGFS